MQKSNPSFNFNKILNRIIVVVGVGIIAHLIFLLYTNDKNVFQYLAQIKIPYLILIICLLLYNWIGHAIRLVIWTRYLKNQFKFKEALKVAVATELGAAVTPTLIGGGPIKLGLLIRNGLSTGKAGFLTLLNGLEDFIMYTSVLLVGLIHARADILRILNSIKQFIASNAALIGGIFFVIILVYQVIKRLGLKINLIPEKYSHQWQIVKKELGSGWDEMKDSFNKVRKDGLRYLVVSYFIMLSQWISRFTVLIVLLYALGVEFKAFQIYLQQWIVYLTMIFIPTPGATGGAEATFFLLFEGEIPKDLLPLIVSTWRFFIYYLMLFMAVIFVQVMGIAKTKD